MNIKQQIEDLLTANFEGLPIPDRLGAASALSTLYHFVVDNDLEQDYCSRQPILAAADRCYTALLMSYINCNNAAQATKILLAQADLIFGLQAVPNRRRVDCFLSAATKHLTQALKSSNSSPKSGSAAPFSFSLSFSYDHRSSSPNAMDEASIAKAQRPTPKAMDVASIAKAQCPMPNAMDVASIAKAQRPTPNAMDVASIAKAQSPMPNAMDEASIAKAQRPTPNAMDEASIAKAQSPMPNAMETLVSIILTFGGTLPKEVEHLLATGEDTQAQSPTPNAGGPAAQFSSSFSFSLAPAPAAPAHRFSDLQNTINKLEQEIQNSIFV